MLTIRHEQIAIFNETRRDRFRDRMVDHIAKEYPRRFAEWGEAGTREFLTAATEKAATHGIDTEAALTLFIELLVESGGTFERSPDRQYIRNILNHPTLPGDAKVESIRRRIHSRTQGRVINIHRGGTR